MLFKLQIITIIRVQVVNPITIIAYVVFSVKFKPHLPLPLSYLGGGNPTILKKLQKKSCVTIFF